jgi:hypothetical protein
MCLITFIFFSFIFYNKFVEIYKLYPCKTAFYVKRQKKFQNFFGKICFLWSRYGAGTGTGTGTGTVTFQK